MVSLCWEVIFLYVIYLTLRALAWPTKWKCRAKVANSKKVTSKTSSVGRKKVATDLDFALD